MAITVNVAPVGIRGMGVTPMPYIYWDDFNDPEDQGWVLRYEHDDDWAEQALEADDIDAPLAAAAEATAFLERQ